MLDLKIAEISSTAGASNNGVVRGSINQSLFVTAQTSSVFMTTMYVLRKDSGVVDTYKDVSTDAIGTTVNGFLPWGTDTEFSAGDEIWIAANKDICEVYVQIDTPGVWVGDGVEVLESVDGETLVAAGGLVDGSNGLRAVAGTYLIKFNDNDNRKAISPTFGGTKRKYIVIRPKNLTSKTTSPKLRRIWAACHIGAQEYTDISIVNNAVTDSNFSPFDNITILPAVGLQTYLGFDGLTMGIDRTTYRNLTNSSAITFVYEYYASDGTWKPFPDFVDPSNNFALGPAVLGSTGELFKLRWTVPSDWTRQTLTLNATVGAKNAYWYRDRMTAVSNYAGALTTLWRARSLSFGSGLSNGIYMKNAVNFTHLTYEIGIPSTTSVVVAFTNAITGSSRSVTIPANSTNSGSLTGGRLDFSSTLNIAAGEMLLISHVSGTGTLQDCEFHLRIE